MVVGFRASESGVEILGLSRAIGLERVRDFSRAVSPVSGFRDVCAGSFITSAPRQPVSFRTRGWYDRHKYRGLSNYLY